MLDDLVMRPTPGLICVLALLCATAASIPEANGQDVTMFRARMRVYEEHVRQEADRLSKALQKRPEPAVKAKIIRAMISMGALADEEGTVKALGDKDPRVRVAALEAVRAQRYFSAMKVLSELALKAGPEEAVLAVLALARLGDERAGKALVRCLKTRKEPPVFKAALRGAVRVAGSRALKPLLGMLESADDERVGLLVDALARIGDHAALDPMFRNLAHRWHQGGGGLPEVWRDALLSFMDRERGEKLLEAAGHEDGAIRLLAVELLGELRLSGAGETLGGLLSDPDALVRRAAVRGLGKIGGDEAGALLTSFHASLSDPAFLQAGPPSGVTLTANFDQNEKPMPPQYREVQSGGPTPEERLAGVVRAETEAGSLARFKSLVLRWTAAAQGKAALGLVTKQLGQGASADLLAVLADMGDPSGCAAALRVMTSDADALKLAALKTCIKLCPDLKGERFKAAWYALGDRLAPGVALDYVEKLSDAGILDSLKSRYPAMKPAERLRYIGLAARSLGPEAGPFLLDAAKRSADVAELRALTEGMCTAGARKEAEAVVKVVGQKAEVVEVPYDKDDDTSSPIHSCIGKMLLPRKRQALMHLVKGRDPAVQISAIRVLSAGRARGADKMAEKLLGSAEASVRKAGLQALATLGDKKVYSEAMSQALRDADPVVKKTAVFSAVKALGEDATQRLVGLLANPELSIAAVDAMGALKSAAMPLMFRFFNASEVEQEHILVTLGRVGDPVAAELLAPLTLRSAPRLKKAAAGSLSLLNAPLSIAYLENLLGDDEAAVRKLAARTLGAMKAGEAADEVAELLADEDDEVLVAAAQALGNMGAVLAVDRLVVLLLHPAQPVRVSAARALKQLNSREAAPALEWMHSQHRHQDMQF